MTRAGRWLRRLALVGAAAAVLPAHADLPAVVDAVKPAIVAVGYFKPTNSPRFTLRGTGFAVGDGRLLVTNAHVLGDAGAPSDATAQLTVQVRAAAGLEARPARVVEVDPVHDLALLAVDGRPLPALRLREGRAAREGDAVALTGFPLGSLLGFAPVTHRGIVSSITPVALPAPASRQLAERAVAQLREGSFDVLQLDATAYPGNSGGPLFDVDTGEVLGVVSMAFVRETREAALARPSGISYAIPVNYVVEMLRRHATGR